VSTITASSPRSLIFNWRTLLPIHPAAKLFPLMSESDIAALKELAENIKANGLVEPIVIWNSSDGQSVLDGRNRLDAMALLGLLYETGDHHVGVKEWDGRQWTDRPDGRNGYEFVKNLYDGDPYAIALSLNVHRRHLTNKKKRELIAKVLKAQPAVSNVTVAKQTMADDKTVAKVRRELETTSEIPRLEKSVGEDGKARPVKARKKSISTTISPAPIKAAIIEPEMKPALAVTIPTQAGTLGSAIVSEWREAISAFEILTSHTPAQVAAAVSPEDVSLVTEIANFFAKLVKLTCDAGVDGSDYPLSADLSIPQRGVA
jgi:hypothetical protein